MPLPIRLGGLGERRKLSQRGLGRSPSRNRFRCILPLKSDLRGANNFHKFPISQPIKLCAIGGDHTIHKHIYEEWGRVAMAHLNSQCTRPPFLSATAVGVRGQSPTEADDILALEHTFYFALSFVVFE